MKPPVINGTYNNILKPSNSAVINMYVPLHIRCTPGVKCHSNWGIVIASEAVKLYTTQARAKF